MTHPKSMFQPQCSHWMQGFFRLEPCSHGFPTFNPNSCSKMPHSNDKPGSKMALLSSATCGNSIYYYAKSAKKKNHIAIHYKWDIPIDFKQPVDGLKYPGKAVDMENVLGSFFLEETSYAIFSWNGLQGFTAYISTVCLGLSPCPVTVTTRITMVLVGQSL